MGDVDDNISQKTRVCCLVRFKNSFEQVKVCKKACITLLVCDEDNFVREVLRYTYASPVLKLSCLSANRSKHHT